MSIATTTALYMILASQVGARAHCLEHGNLEWYDRHKERGDSLVKEHMPSGSGFDCGTSFDWDDSTPEKLVFNTSFHHMDEHGGYDGWTEHRVTVKASLQFGFVLTIGGRNRNDIKTMISDYFSDALDLKIDTQAAFADL